MLGRVFSCAVIGLEGVVVDVEVDYGQGLPGITILGPKDHHFFRDFGGRFIRTGPQEGAFKAVGACISELYRYNRLHAWACI
jgi:hypothetical protein